MTNDSQRIFKLEQMLRVAQQQIIALQTQVGQLLQNQAASAGSASGFLASSTAAYALPLTAASIPAADGVLAGQINTDILQLQGNTLVSVVDQTVYNPAPYPIGLGALGLIPVSPGNFMAVPNLVVFWAVPTAAIAAIPGEPPGTLGVTGPATIYGWQSIGWTEVASAILWNNFGHILDGDVAVPCVANSDGSYTAIGWN